MVLSKRFTLWAKEPNGIQDAHLRTRSIVPTWGASVLRDLIGERKRLDVPSTRRSSRIPLQVPVFVRGTDAFGSEFIELTKTLNISAIGACIASQRVLAIDQTVHLTIPSPSPATSGLVPSETPPIVARVLRQDQVGEMRLFGLEFLRPLE
jgi:hypothetical protein